MWILKGTLLGLWLLGFGTLAFLYFAIYRNLQPNTAVALSVITANTIRNPLWWVAGIVCFVLSYAITRSWEGPRLMWAALLVTGLVPTGLLAMFVTMVVMLKRASRGHP